jgi:hypothetical protein
MNTISILQPPSDEYLRIAGEKYGLSQDFIDTHEHPQEDYVSVSGDLPVCVVADGVTLDVEELVDQGVPYPNPSPSGRVAEIFCESVTTFSADVYDSFDQPDIKRVFAQANERVAEYNQTVNRKELVNNPTGEFAATGAFLVKKRNTVYWATICDSVFAHFDSEMNQKFMSTGSCDPYAVINGEDRVVDFTESGVRNAEAGDKLFLFTDGFEHYFNHEQFLQFFTEWEDGLPERVRNFSQKIAQEKPKKFGHERSLIAIRV